MPLQERKERRKSAMKGRLNIPVDAAESWMAIDFPQCFSAKCSVIRGIAEGR
jgi:hypothetical protein